MSDFWQNFADQIDLKCTLMHFELRDEFSALNRSIGQKLRAGTGAKWVYEARIRQLIRDIQPTHPKGNQYVAS